MFLAMVRFNLGKKLLVRIHDLVRVEKILSSTNAGALVKRWGLNWFSINFSEAMLSLSNLLVYRALVI